MDILGLSTSPSSGGAYALVLSESQGNRRLPIIIGTYEAQAIALELEHIKPPRPMTHDLLKNTIEALGGTLKKVIINELRDGTFFAKLHIESTINEVEIDARPSDAVALAIRFGVPIMVDQKVLEEAGIEHDSSEGEEAVPSEVSSKDDSVRKDQPQSFKPEDKLSVLKSELSAAIQNEDYEKAAKIRDEINKLESN